QQISKVLAKLETKKNPFHGDVDARHLHWTKPELVAEIKFTEWTHETDEGGVKLRAPVFMGLREDKRPEECTFEDQMPRNMWHRIGDPALSVPWRYTNG